MLHGAVQGFQFYILSSLLKSKHALKSRVRFYFRAR
jgi:hypothetical protein